MRSQTPSSTERRTRSADAASPPLLTLAANGHEVQVPPSAVTLAGFRDWAHSPEFPRCGRLSYLGGTVFIDMSPEKIESHNKVKTEVTRVIANLNAREDLGEVYSDRTLLTSADAELSTEADCAFAKWETLEAGRVRPVRHEGEVGDYLEIEGAPDWVLEVVSDSSVKKDTQDLRERYHRAGVSEYLLIDARGEQINFTILVRKKGGFVPAPVENGWQRSTVFGRRFRLTRARGRLDLWRYTLQVKK